ncbi:class I SAM-dependent methyltransferase [Novosphingobium mangrovi (ex Huang et al. 2023)]|uniref:Class I SAM-dependent methyltransferase n=1 Tax=Novosphingobium mangrovi (ex Huang et al. 2023) TaxID=2976432 RepID=A0ABT2I580_9SPHN|nr:class I SAM-dependent methyltransferase [Novosphingobium mangrovi (ex Huang et al. 2023)]MCT2399763.1 class I SAM-dependent methyltransferase [Novosphingobium mangrovi (ex Huang et al. 2023)]
MTTTMNNPAGTSPGSDWNAETATHWIAAQSAMEAMLRPFSQVLCAYLEDIAEGHVLDVGCGTGATTFDIQNQLKPGGQCTGIDISEAMTAVARERAAREGSRARFICADAQGHDFGHARFDAVVSRFGVMFFNDPVAAFANLRGACADGAPLHMVTWRSPAENPFMTLARDTALPLLPAPIARQDKPTGQFAFADPAHVTDNLAHAGWSDIAIETCDAACVFPVGALKAYAARMGPIGRLMPLLDSALQERVTAAVLDAYHPYVHGDEVRFNAACWVISARS